MKSFLNLLQKCPQILHVHQLIIFICGAVTILKLQIFAEFSTRVSDPDKNFSASNLGKCCSSIKTDFVWDPHTWSYGGPPKWRFWGAPIAGKNENVGGLSQNVIIMKIHFICKSGLQGSISEVCLKTKEKNDSTSEQATARYTWNFFKIWVSRIISYLRRVRSTCRRTSYVHTEGTENENIRHKNPNFSCVLAISHHSQKPSKSAIFSKFFFSRKSSINFLLNAVFRLL